ncbi:MAG: sulfate reduction electron transfer complex DsrMKJOP subunit DsrP [Elusimicrobiota bacterium]
MLEKALIGSKKYYLWMAFLAGVIGVGMLFYLKQFCYGLGVTGLSRDVSWGFYIAQFTFLVGVAASAVMVVLPYYLHDYKAFGKITILGEFIAVPAVIMCQLFIFVDMGQPLRLMNAMLYPTPGSMIFWDIIALSGYLGLNLLIGFVTLSCERKDVPPPSWIKPVIILSIPWAVSIHTVTAFLYSGLAARPFWMTAVLAPRFLASAFAAGPALLILLCLVLRKISKFDAGEQPIQKLGVIVTYAMVANVFFVLMELFTAFYSGIPEHMAHFEFLFVGLAGNTTLVPWMRTSAVLGLLSLGLLLWPGMRRKEGVLAAACVMVFASLWIDKGLGMIIAGFIPSPLGTIPMYWPTMPELMVSLGIYGIGAFILSALYKMVLTMRGQVAA